MPMEGCGWMDACLIQEWVGGEFDSGDCVQTQLVGIRR